MRDLDTAFGELRRAFTDDLTAPEVTVIQARSRRRIRTRAATMTAALAVALAGSAFAVNGTGGSEPPPVVATPSASPLPAARLPVLSDLVHGREIRPMEDFQNHWVRSGADGPEFPLCNDKVDVGGLFDADHIDIRSSIALKFDGNPEAGNEDTSTSRTETVFVFTSVDKAKLAMRTLERAATGCGRSGLDEFKRLDFGDQSFRGADTEDGQRQQGVAVRQGASIAIYGSVRNNGRQLVTLDQMENDARTMTKRLTDLGYRD